MKFTPTVIEFRVEKEFRWLGKLWSERLFSGEHAFLLEESGGGKTLFIQKETFRGILVPVIMGLTGSSTKRGFEEMNKALKHEAET